MPNRTIQSPGVQISEVDLSLNPAVSPQTTVFIPGFASKGPTSQPITIDSVSTLQQIYGSPTNAAERYFFNSAQAALNSPANVVTYRLPYGAYNGIDTSTDYSALVYPVVSVSPGASATSTALGLSAGTYYFGTPSHIKLTQNQYISIVQGNGFTWSNNTSGTTVFDQVASLSAAGIVILNKSQSTINNRFEGNYIGIIDQSYINPTADYTEFSGIYTINSTFSTIQPGSYLQVPSTRLNFPLTAANTNGASNSVSQVIQNIPTFDITSTTYNDTLVIGLYKLRQSVFAPDSIALDYVLQEGYVGSIDAHRQINSPTGGQPNSFFLGNVENNSNNIQVLVNNYIAGVNSSGFLDLSGNPLVTARFLNAQTSLPLANETYSAYQTRMGATSGVVNSALTAIGTTNGLYALGDYITADPSTKLIGNVPAKLGQAFNYIANDEIYPLSITCEAGLGTIYVNSFNPATSGYFDDTISYNSMLSVITGQNVYSSSSDIQNYLAVANQFVNFASVQRKDHLTILDPITNIFVQNGVKTLDNPNNNFSLNLYWPLRNQFASINTSYATTYANVVKVLDVASNQQVWVPFSGFAAAAMANTDSNFYPWYAPMGLTRGIITGINDLALYPNQKQCDALYKVSLNPLKYFPGDGFVIWGEKTLQTKPSAFDRINVRRLFLTLEVAIKAIARYYVGEPNTLFTRTNLVNDITPILQNAQNTNGLQGFLVVCSEANNTSAVLQDNALVCDIYLKPVRTAEYILVNFYAVNPSVDFTEIVNNQ